MDVQCGGVCMHDGESAYICMARDADSSNRYGCADVALFVFGILYTV